MVLACMGARATPAPAAAGNLLFVASYEWRSLGALLTARLLNGLGSARAANRRYTADYVGRGQRTMASAGGSEPWVWRNAAGGHACVMPSCPAAQCLMPACLPAAFVRSSNLGMALGPLLSLPLSALPDMQASWLGGGEGRFVARECTPRVHCTGQPPACCQAFLTIAKQAAPSRLPQVAGLLLNPVTAVGWVMAACWLLFIAATAAWFPEPQRHLPIGLARHSSLPRGGLAGAGGRRSAKIGMHQPLLSEVASGAAWDAEAQPPASAEQLSMAAEPAGAGGPPLPREWQQQEFAAAWRATLPGTIACTVALLVQKMVRGL